VQEVDKQLAWGGGPSVGAVGRTLIQRRRWHARRVPVVQLKILAPPAAFVALLSVMWVLLDLTWISLPYVRPGADVIYAAKQQWAQNLTLFQPDVHDRVVLFGNSKAMTGFIPELFDSQVHGPAAASGISYNFGLPDSVRFVDTLQTLAARDQAPNTVFLTFSWQEPDASDSPSPFHFLDQDGAIMDALFPFRALPRDLVLFATIAPTHGGLKAYYSEGEAAVAQMRADRGYYFIAGQSHFEGDRLPDDFRVETDQPTQPYARHISPTGAAFAALRQLAAQAHIRFYFVPQFFRVGEFAPAPSGDQPDPTEVNDLQRYPEFAVLGPPYVLLPNKYFSDPEHLNPEGARVYTSLLSSLYQQAAPPR